MTAERTWRLVGAIGMTLGVLSLVVSTILQWVVQPSDPAGTPIDLASESPGFWLFVSLLGVLGPLVWIAGIVAVTMIHRSKWWQITSIGGYLTGAGLVAGVGHLAVFFGVISDAAASGIGADAGLGLLQADGASTLSNVLLYSFLVGFSLGPILLTIGLRLVKLVPVWVPVAAIVMVAANFIGGIPAGAVQLLAAIATFGPMVVLLLRKKDTEVAAV